MERTPTRQSMDQHLNDYGLGIRVLSADGLRLVSKTVAGGARIPRHTHERTTISISLTGMAVEDVGRRVKSQRCPGMVWCLPSDTEHSLSYAPSAARTLTLEFDSGLWDSATEHQRLLQRRWSISCLPDALFALRLHRMMATSDDRDTICTAHEFLAACLAHLAVSVRERSRPVWLARVRDRIASAPEEPVSVVELAHTEGIDVAHLCRTFKQRFGMTPGEYRRDCRAAAVCRWIVSGERVPAAAAVDAGFSDQSHLGRWLKRRAAVTPASIRHQ